ncbi:hypothetical protein [Kibdelosporangium philippinense]|uniref:hypothetical protein n=1 Tax=Kibdelosporangium philippinense TaxID=211113 RepID=UPI003605C6D9
MTWFESIVDCYVLQGACARVGLGYTVEAAAVRLADDIAELRNDGGPWTRADFDCRIASVTDA